MINQITGKLAICEATDIIPINISNGAIHYDCVLNVDQIDHPGERELCESLGITYIWQPVPRKRTKTNAQFKKDLCIAADMLERISSHYKRILVHCYAGFDRAPFVVAKYLSSVAALSIPQAYSIIKQQRPIMEHYEWI
jgi:hypothetical protein